MAFRLIDPHLNVDNEGEDVRIWFPCPFCYVEIEVPMLCCHLQDEHCFDLKNAVCPICAASVGKDPIVHFSVQHAQSVKRRRKYLKSGYRDNATAMFGKDLQDIALYFETNSEVGRYKPAADPLLLPFLCNVPPTHTESRWQDKSSVCDTATTEIESSAASRQLKQSLIEYPAITWADIHNRYQSKIRIKDEQVGVPPISSHTARTFDRSRRDNFREPRPSKDDT